MIYDTLKPYFDNIEPLKGDEERYLIYQAMPQAQRVAFGLVGKELQFKIARLTEAQAFELTYAIYELYERSN